MVIDLYCAFRNIYIIKVYIIDLPFIIVNLLIMQLLFDHWINNSRHIYSSDVCVCVKCRNSSSVNIPVLSKSYDFLRKITNWDKIGPGISNSDITGFFFKYVVWYILAPNKNDPFKNNL